MSISKLISPLALAAAISLSGAAMAQTMIGGKAIPEDQLEAVTQKCTELTTASLTAPTEAEDDDTDAATPAEPEGDQSGDEQEEGESADPADPAAIDLETLTAELCKEAGLPTP
jgi:hypothetical protein